jgi:hypothetical protein
MKMLFFCQLWTLILFGSSCGPSVSEREQALIQKEKEIAERERSLALKEIEKEGADSTTSVVSYEPVLVPQKIVKYMYVYIITDEPKITRESYTTEPPPRKPPSYSGNPYMPELLEAVEMPQTRFYKSVKHQKFYYLSGIVRVDDYNEDERAYKTDIFSKGIEKQLEQVNRMLEMDNRMYSGEDVNVQAKIISRKSFIFDSYLEASNHREETRSNN